MPSQSFQLAGGVTPANILISPMTMLSANAFAAFAVVCVSNSWLVDQVEIGVELHAPRRRRAADLGLDPVEMAGDRVGAHQ